MRERGAAWHDSETFTYDVNFLPAVAQRSDDICNVHGFGLFALRAVMIENLHAESAARNSRMNREVDFTD